MQRDVSLSRVISDKGSVKVPVAKVCPWDGFRCRNSCCSTLSPTGFVELCIRHRNPNGRFRRRKVLFDGF